MKNYIEGLIKIKKNELVFSNEYFAELQKLNNNQTINKRKVIFSYVESLNQNKIFNKNELNFVLKKIREIRFALYKKLNLIHSTNHDQNYWGLLIDHYLFFLIKFIYRELKVIKLKPNYYKVLNKENKKFLKFKSLKEFHNNFNNKSTKIFLKKKIFEYFIKKKKEKFFLFKKENIKADFNFSNYFVLNLLNFLLNIFKPVLIAGGYMGKLMAFKIFIKSFGKILVVPENFFPEIDKDFIINNKMRENMEIEGNSHFIKLFNILNKLVFPGSLLENYNFFSKKFKLISNKINNLGNSGAIFENDTVKFLAVYQKKLGKKIFSFQHGSHFNVWKDSIFEIYEKKYLDIRFSWNDKNSFGSQYLPRLKINKTNKKKYKDIVFLTAQNYLNDPLIEPLEKKNHPSKNLNFEIYKNLKLDLKLASKIKLFPSKESTFTSNIWKNKFGKKIKVFSDTSIRSISFFRKAKIVIIDDISTPLYELFYLNIPFILVMDSFHRLNKNLLKKIFLLKKMNILFLNPVHASRFLNKNYGNIEEWWSYNIKQKNFKELKKLLFEDKKFEIEEVIKKRLINKI